MTNHIQIPNVPPRIRYTGNGTQTEFIYPFPILNSAQLKISIDASEQLTQFSILNAGKTTGGTVIFDYAPATGAMITLERVLPLQRISDFIEGGELAANALNNEFDYLMASTQQIDENQKPMLRFDKNEALPDPVIPSKTVRANKVLGFDGNGALELFETTDTYASPNYTQNGSGAISRSLNDKAREFVSVKDFGAIGDGIEDDTNPIKNALAAHDCIFIPPGTYRITATLEIGDGKLITGAGAVSIIKTANNNFDAIAMIGTYSVLQHLCIDGGETGLRLYGKNASFAHNSAGNILFQNQSVGIELDGYIDPQHGCDGNRLYQITIEKPALHGVLVTRSGFGNYPRNNKFYAVRVTSLDNPISGCGFYAEGARQQNSFTDCAAILSGTAQACFKIGGESEQVIINGLYTQSTNHVPNIVLENGSVETTLLNLQSNSNGAAILDNSGGDYVAFNAGYPDKNRFGKTRITELKTDQHYLDFHVIAPAIEATIPVDLSKTMHMVSANNAPVTLQLPKASSGNAGAVITLQKTDVTSNPVLVTEFSGDGPDGKTTRLGSRHDVLSVISDGVMWRSLHTNIVFHNTAYYSNSGTHTPDITRSVHLADATSGLTILELLPANNATSIGRIVTIKKLDASANAVRVTVSGGTGPDNVILNLTARYQAVTVISNGTAWHVIGKV